LTHPLFEAEKWVTHPCFFMAHPPSPLLSDQSLRIAGAPTPPWLESEPTSNAYDADQINIRPSIR
jgi:hypothetical protein